MIFSRVSHSPFTKCTTGNAGSFNLSEKTLELATLSKFLYMSLILWAQSLQARPWPTVKYCLPWLCPFLQAQMNGIWLNQVILSWKCFCECIMREPRGLCHKLLKKVMSNKSHTDYPWSTINYFRAFSLLYLQTPSCPKILSQNMLSWWDTIYSDMR